jgi:hypothetical protein
MIRAALLFGLLLAYGADPEHEGKGTTVDMTLTWLGALTDGRAIAVAAFTAFPFSYRESWSKKRCSRSVANADAIGAWVDCAHERESRLIQELRAARRDPGRLRLSPGLNAASKRLRALAQGATNKAWINGSLKGDGVKYEFLFAISGNDVSGRRVSAMLVDSSLEPR